MFKNIFKKRKNSSWIYKLLKTVEPVAVLGVWEKHLQHYTDIIGYSATGALFIMSPETKEYLVFYPSMPGNNCKGYGAFESIYEFEETILKESSFPEFGLYPIDLALLNEIHNKLGPLDEHQIYFPALDPELGGTLELKNFTKGDIWVRTDIVGQNRGIE